MKQRKRRGNIYGRKDRPGWEIKYYTPAGKRISVYVKGTHREAEDKLAQLRVDSKTGMFVEPSRLTVADFFTKWLDAVSPSLRPKTRDHYKRTIKKHIVPRLGDARLQRLGSVDIQNFFSGLDRDGVGAPMRQVVYRVMYKAMNQAVAWNLITRNPCVGVIPPRRPHREMKVWDTNEMATFLEAAKTDRLYPLYLLALHTGMRQAELTGLKWSDIDVAGRRLRVQRQLIETKGQGKGEVVFAPPKTKAGQRSIPLSPMALDALKAHREQMLAKGRYQADGLVFTDSQGKPLRKSNLLRRSFFKIIERAEVKRIRFHDLRHTFATHFGPLLGARSLQAIMGHANISLTLGLYGHVLPTHEAEAETKIQAFFEALPAPKQPAKAKVVELPRKAAR